MPSLISERSWADQAGVSIGADAEVVGLGVRSLLTSVLADVWRTPGVVQADAVTSLNHDTASVGSNTTRAGNVAGSDGTANRAVRYQNSSAANSYVTLRTGYPLLAGRTYRVDLQARRVNGASTSGNLIHVTGADGSLYSLPMTNLAQGTAWQSFALTFVAAGNTTASILAAVNTGTLDFALDVSSITLLPAYAAGTRAATLDLDLGAAQPVRVLAMAAPPDGMLPAGGSLIRVTAGSSAGAADLLDTGNLPLAMPRGYWAWVGAAVVTARYWRVQINWPGSQPYLQFGRLWLGDALVPAANPSADGYEPAASDDVATVPVRRESWQILRLSESEADEVERIGLAVGTQVQVLAIPRTERAAYTAVIGKFGTIPRAVPRQAWASGQSTRLYSATLTVQGDR
ncbi:Hypothetical protein RADP37_05295 [Roseomonas mucosa]|uniref:Uncharacterized protein n=1 Tax=Roseomonas mucosa TaxID=207340 RepID=A0A4Y1MUS9_9PROT|nr:hypothetical protein [Roseomonas mucosa]AWV21708.1 Hypothetical protein RADP37_05295 [Roseomonas mucosa]MDT8276696.1 hypothetical protein [Roseomonas mucosa]MDT8355256.1 hypothetical protein [Roseomonas mucosa]